MRGLNTEIGGAMVGLSHIEARNTKTGRNNLSKLWGKFGFKVEGGVARGFLRMTTPIFYLNMISKSRGGAERLSAP